jgi:trehalose 6-phosphate synthase/phosphatase
MHIVSYRGPGMAGGVSAALTRAWECNWGTGGLWWYMSTKDLQVTAGAGAQSKIVAEISEEVIKGHYRYCNDFLWPVMHDLPQYAHYSSEDHEYYDALNETVGWCLARANQKSPETANSYFVQDYQWALVPSLLSSAGLRSLVFWHIPWPANVDERFAAPLAEIARGLLNSEGIGFHTDEYATNFLRFVQERLPEYGCSPDSMAIWSTDNVAHVHKLLWAEPERYRTATRSGQAVTKHITRLIVAPLGIDFDHWQNLSARQQNTLWHPSLLRTPFILSVDRADYTKGVTDRLLAIDHFFAHHPEWRGRISFAQICGKTRCGLTSFDNYWEECRGLFERLKSNWETDNWQPLIWFESSFKPVELAHAYSTASGMLISAVRDGLNLTAKEYVACQTNKPGVLMLSSGAGAWHELENHCVTLTPGDVPKMAEAIHSSLVMDAHERSWRMAVLKDTVRNNTLNRWWFTFANLLRTDSKRIPHGLLRESS